MPRYAFDLVTTIRSCLWKPTRMRNAESSQEDIIQLLELTGRQIGSSLDGKRRFYVQDGIVYMTWPGVDVSCVDYFMFCNWLRSPAPAGRTLDFQAAPGFHLGQPEATDQCNSQPMTPPMADLRHPPGSPMWRNPRLDDLDKSPSVESAPVDNPMRPMVPLDYPTKAEPAKQTGGGPAPFVLMHTPDGMGGPYLGLGPATINAFLHLKANDGASCCHIVPQSNRAHSREDAVRRVFKGDGGLVLYQDSPNDEPKQVTPMLFT